MQYAYDISIEFCKFYNIGVTDYPFTYCIYGTNLERILLQGNYAYECSSLCLIESSWVINIFDNTLQGGCVTGIETFNIVRGYIRGNYVVGSTIRGIGLDAA